MLEKIKNFVKTTKGKLVSAVSSGLAVASTSITAFATDGAGTTSTFKSGIDSLWTQITEQVNIGNVVSIIGICLGACLGLALFWFGLRYVIRKIMAAVKKGKVSA